MKKLLFALIFMSASLIGAQTKVVETPSEPMLVEGQTLADVDELTNQALKEFRVLLGNDLKTAAVFAQFEKHFIETARLFKLYITNPNPRGLQAYYDAYAVVQSDIEKIKKANPVNQKAFAPVSAVNKTMKLR